MKWGGLAEMRRAARAAGQARFFTGEPCPNGHIAERQTASGRCVDCHLQDCKNNYAKNSDRIKQNAKAWRARNRARKNKANSDWAKQNPEKMAAKAMVWRQKNPDKVRATSARYRKRHPDRIDVWKLANLDKIRNYTRNRRRRLDGAGGCHTVGDIKEILKLQRGRCAYCRRRLRDDYHVDHIIAVTRGGSNDRSNLQILCPTCNHRKFNHDPIDFAQSIGMLL